MKKLALLFVSAIALSGCQTVLVSHSEALLENAGFKATPADTPARQALLTGLPARQVMAGTDGTYVYADPLVCNCLYIGSYVAYAKYRCLMNIAARSPNGLPPSVNNATSTTPPMPGFGYVPPARR